MINGNWEVPTLVDLEKSKKLTFEYGIQAFPKLAGNSDTWADSHQLAIPNNQKNPPTPEKVAAALKFIAYVVKQQTWAGGGHIPAYLPLQQSDSYKQMVPNNEYSADAAKQVTLEPPLPIFGVASPSFSARLSPIRHVRSAWPIGWPSVRSSANDMAASTSDTRTLSCEE